MDSFIASQNKTPSDVVAKFTVLFIEFNDVVGTELFEIDKGLL